MSKITQKAALNAINGSAGIITTIASKLGCSWATAKRYIENNPIVREAYLAEQEKVLDLAESKLVAAINKGDTATAKWLLIRKGKDRGYGETVKIETWQDEIVRYLADGKIEPSLVKEAYPDLAQEFFLRAGIKTP